MKVHLERIDHVAGMARFYKVLVLQTLFGEWVVVKEWGRIGQGGTVRDQFFASEAEACGASKSVVAAKTRRGYRLVG
jgi:predicted DNA-binding WGR domain protein